MKLTKARDEIQNHPHAQERIEILEQQLQALRKDFFGHMMNLERIEAREKQFGILPDYDTAKNNVETLRGQRGTNDPEVYDATQEFELVSAKISSEAALDDIDVGIKATLDRLTQAQQQLKAVNPDIQFSTDA